MKMFDVLGKIRGKIYSPENIFLIFCIVACSFFIFINPPFQAPDEPEHFFKMYGYTQGSLNFKKTGNNAGQILPKGIAEIDKTLYHLRSDGVSKIKHEEIERFKALKLNKNDTVFYPFTPTAYTPFSYFPSFILLWVLKVFNVAPFLMLQIMKFCSMFVYAGLVYASIRLTPINKYLFALIALLPTALYEGCSISSDPLVMGLCFLFTAYVLRLAVDNEIKKFTKKDFWKFGLLITWISICKFSYLPMIFMFFMIPKEKFDSQKNRLAYFWSLLCLNLIFVAAFVAYVIQIFKGLVPTYPTYSHLEKSVLIKYILTHPLQYLKACVTTVIALSSYYVETLIGRLGWLNVVLPAYVIKGYFVLLALTSFFTTAEEKKEHNLTVKMRAIMFGAYCACMFMILTSVYLTFQYYPLIEGVQGRYLLPVIPLFCLFFYNKKLNFKYLPLLIIICSIFLLHISMVVLMQRYYI